MLFIPQELTEVVQELVYLYSKGYQDAVMEALSNLLSVLKRDFGLDITDNHLLEKTIADDIPTEDYLGFLKSWQDILGFQVYVDTDIYGSLDNTPANPITEEVEPKVVKHDEATEAYVKSWSDIADKLSTMPDDLFNRYWGTSEMANIIGCSPNTLRKAKQKNTLPLKFDNFMVDCAGYKGRKILWGIRPI